MDVSIRSTTPHSNALESLSSSQLPATYGSDRYSTSTMDRVSNESNIGLLASAATAANHYIHAPVDVTEPSTVEKLSTSSPLSPHNARVPCLTTTQSQHSYMGSVSKSPVVPSGGSASTTINESKSSSRGGTPSGNRVSSTPNPEKPFACDQCDQTFSRQHNLKSHYLTHTQERPYECSVCNQHFRRHHDLKRHSKLHTGERPYQCTICERSFARLDALNRHLRAEREGGGGCSGVSRGTRARCPSGEKEVNTEKNLGSNLPAQQATMPADTTHPVVSQSSKQHPNFAETGPGFRSEPLGLHSRGSNSPRFRQDKHQTEELTPLTSSAQHSSSSKVASPTSIALTQPNPMILKGQTQPYALPTEHLSRIYAPTGHHLTMSPIQIQVPHLDYLPQPNLNNLQYQGIRVESHTGYNSENISSDPGYRDSSVSSHSNDDTASPHPIQKTETNTGFCPSSEITFLQEKNEYLEARVRELEADLINERIMKRRRECLEERVRELEIEKSLLKSLLIERDDYSSRLGTTTVSTFLANPNANNVPKELAKKRRVV